MSPGLATAAVARSNKKKPKNACPECGKDIHDPDCAFYEKSR
jgi:hypothetical protein